MSLRQLKRDTLQKHCQTVRRSLFTFESLLDDPNSVAAYAAVSEMDRALSNLKAIQAMREDEHAPTAVQEELWPEARFAQPAPSDSTSGRVAVPPVSDEGTPA